MQAALTGHLVLATLHTNSALAAIPRLTDMGIEPYRNPRLIQNMAIATITFAEAGPNPMPEANADGTICR